MKRIIFNWILRLKGAFGFNKRIIIDVDSLVEENSKLMNEIRLNRKKFYKFYHKAQNAA